jgi:isopentenyl-diphosphate delta-isomerase
MSGAAEFVVLVDRDDREIGTEEKLRAHELGALHRAFSVFVMDDQGRVLLQRRASGKYHSAGLWTNTCCGHPRPGEDIRTAATRRLREEMGITCDLEERGVFIYEAELDHGLREHELDHVFVGRFNRDPLPDPLEADDWAWRRWPEIDAEYMERPERFTVWFAPARRTLSKFEPPSSHEKATKTGNQA